MRILQVTATYYPELQFGGAPHKIHPLSCGLAKRGHEVKVVTFYSAQPTARQSQVFDGIQVQYLPWIGQGSWQAPLDLGKLVEAVQEADIVHCYGLYNLLCPAAAFWAHHVDRPFLLEPLGMYIARGRNVPAKVIYHRLFTSRMARWATRVVATSPREIEELSGLVEGQRLVLRRDGIDLAPFQNLPAGDSFRARYTIDDHERVVLFIGRISPVKNLEQLVLAFRQAALERVRLVMVGPMLEPDYATRLQRLIVDLDLDDRILLAGPLYDREKLAALAAADLLVLPSLSESFGLAAAEAVAAGVPVLLTQSCGIAPIIHGRAGLAVPQSTAALAEGLRLMLEDAEERARLTRLRDDVLAELSWEEPLREIERLYTQITRNSSQFHT